MFRKHVRLCLRAALALILSITFLEAGSLSAAQAATAAQVDEVRELINQHHVSKPVESDLNDAAIHAMIDSLNDPYTEYYNEVEWQSFSNSLEQSFTGIGIVMVEEDGIVYVEDVIPGGPAEAAGMLPGDALKSADGESLAGLSISDMQKKLLGSEGTRIRIGVDRDGKRHVFTITRSAFQLPAVTGHMMGGSVGYLALSGFTTDSGKAFAAELEKLEQAGMSSLLLDLRNNGGGYMNAAQQIAGAFLESGILANLRDRDGVDTPITVRGSSKTYPVTILVNGNTASASELLAGALRDYGVATLVGTATYGKGVVQSLIQLKGGGVLKVTVQEYYTPKGNKVDKVGLKPDHVVEGALQQLVAAYRIAGGKQLIVDVHKGFIIVNGVRLPHANAVMQTEDGKWFVNLRLAAALTGVEVGYDPATQMITLRQNVQTRTLSSADERLINKNGWNLIEVEQMIEWYPAMSFALNDGRPQLQFH